MSDTKDSKDIKDNKEVKEFKLSQETFNKQSEEAAKILGITSKNDLILFKKLLQEDLQKIEKIKTAFKEDPKLVKITRTKDRMGEDRSSQNPNKNLTDKDKAIDLNFSMVRTVDEKTKQETIAILMEGRGLKKTNEQGVDVSEVSGKFGKELGAGGFGLAKLGLSLDTLETGAVKISKYNPKKHAENKDQAYVKNVLRGAALKDHQMATELGRTFGQAETTKKHYSFMKFFPGEPCHKILEKNNYLANKLDIAFLMAMRLQELHEKDGYLHLDIKPDNMLYNARPKMLNIIDFGSAAKATKQAEGVSALVPSLGGTRVYRDPYIKQDSNGHYPVTSKYDIYALGLIYLILFYYKGDKPPGNHWELATYTNNIVNQRLNIDDVKGARAFFEQIRRLTSEAKNEQGIDHLVTSMLAKDEADRPYFNKIFSILTNALLAELKANPEFQDIKSSVENSPLFHYIARTEPKKIVDFLMSIARFSDDFSVQEGIEAILSLESFKEFLKQNQNDLNTLSKTFESKLDTDASNKEILKTLHTLASSSSTLLETKPSPITSDFERKKEIKDKKEGENSQTPKQDHPKPS